MGLRSVKVLPKDTLHFEMPTKPHQRFDGMRMGICGLFGLFDIRTSLLNQRPAG